MGSIQERIAALNIGQVGRSPHNPPQQQQQQQQRPTAPLRASSDHAEYAHTDQNGHDIGNQPAGYQEVRIASRPEKKRMPPPPPIRPPKESQAYIVPDYTKKTTPRSLPPPRPALPPRNSSQSIPRRGSQESVSSTVSTSLSVVSSSSTPRTSGSRAGSIDGRSPVLPARSVKAPAYDPSTLPQLPPRRSEQSQPPQRPTPNQGHSSSSSVSRLAPNPPPRPQSRTPSVANTVVDGRGAQFKSPPPQQWAVKYDEPAQEQPRPQSVQRPVSQVQEQAQEAPAVENYGQAIPKRSALSWGMNKATETAPSIPTRPHPGSLHGDAPPPIPTHSRPDLAAIQASKPKSGIRPISYAPTTSQVSCLKCRDFSAADAHAARFPRESIPSQDVGWLAKQLTDPFPSLTDKARALFTWQHHNIAYNVEDFFSGNLKGSTPASTIATGRAVCEGYAGLFAAMAMHAGLEAIVVGGHGAGFGFKPLQVGEPIPPPNPSGHAWNAVKLDDGRWKLIDVCWGAGHVTDHQTYEKAFHVNWFTMDNQEFGLKHFPKDPNHFFRADGRVLSWEEYSVGPDGPGEKVTIMSGCETEHGFSETSFLPKKKHLRVRGQPPKSRIQFQMEKVCEHWNPVKNGKGRPYTYILAIGGKDGRKKDYVPFQTNGSHWWVDVSVEDLGCAGQKVSCYSVATIDGKDGRGITVKEYLEAKGRKAMSFGGVAEWQLV